ncbi:MAG: Gfo/Idh/MocA family oxidoreductase [Candidatus Solibacter sp.]|nr:Gfo/Idh/MocA family oxidoreductase [Candidatus Solibacter sp.]
MTRTSRRSLLAGTLGSSLMAQVDAPPEVRLPRRIRLALAGFDGHPEEILRVLPQLPDVELVAVAGEESDPGAQASVLKNRYAAKARRYETLAQLLAAEQLDAVAVCNHNGRRTAAILACAERKLNVIAEKPLALRRADLDAVYAAVKRSGIHLGMLLPMRFEPPYLAMRRIVEGGAIGEVLQMDAQKSYQLGARPEWQKHAATYGSTILWIAIHGIDLMLWVGGRRFTEAASLQSRVGIPEAGDMQNVTATLFRLDNGGSATLHMDYLRPATASGHGDDRLRVSGSRGIVEYQESTGVTLMTDKSAPEAVRDLPRRQSVFVDFLQSVYQGAKPALSWPEIVRANEATLAAHTAAEQHRFVAIPQG